MEELLQPGDAIEIEGVRVENVSKDTATMLLAIRAPSGLIVLSLTPESKEVRGKFERIHHHRPLN